MNKTDAKRLTVENSVEYKEIISSIERKVSVGKEFSAEYYSPTLRDYATLAYAIVDVLSEGGYEAEYNKFTYTVYVSWS